MPVAFFLALFTGFQCQTDDDPQKELVLAALGLLEITGDYFAKLYRVDPLIAAAPENANLIWEAQSGTADAKKPKIVFVHGWHLDDRDSMNNLSLNDLKNRILKENWSEFFATGEFKILLSLDYEIYAFDYLTSNGIDINGQRFRKDLDSVFGGEENTVIIYAHSMGGLVSRVAVYEGSRPSYMKRVISAGTPYHGSPWASPQFQGSLPAIIESLAGFVTDTTGGQDLAWDNYDNSIPGATNSKLSDLNAKTDRDDLFYTMYGSCTNTNSKPCAGSDSNNTLGPVCPILGSAYSPSDCVVPTKSAFLDGNATHGKRNLGGYDHFDVKVGTMLVRAEFIATIQAE